MPSSSAARATRMEISARVAISSFRNVVAMGSAEDAPRQAAVKRQRAKVTEALASRRARTIGAPSRHTLSRRWLILSGQAHEKVAAQKRSGDPRFCSAMLLHQRA